MKTRSQLKRLFLNVSMVNRIDGLRVIAEKEGLEIKEMQDGDFVFFVNAARTKLAALIGAPQGKFMDGGIMCYYKAPRGTHITVDAIRYIPKFFDGRAMNYEKALEAAITTALAKKPTQHVEGL